MPSTFQHAGQGYAIERFYSVPDDAWYLELAETDPSGRTFLTAIVADEDPDRTPTVCFDEQTGHRDIPYAVMTWFMEETAEEVRSSRGWMEIAPELLGMTRQLRLLLPGLTAEDEQYLPLLAILAELLTDDDLGTVLSAAYDMDPRTVRSDVAAVRTDRTPPPGVVAELRALLAADGWTGGAVR